MLWLQGPKLLQMKHCKVLWVSCCRVAGVFDGLPDVFCREEANVVVQRVVTHELTSYAKSLWVGCVWNYGCELLTESTSCFILVRKSLFVESDSLIWGCRVPNRWICR